MCVYYADEFGFCGKDGFNWANFNKNTMCNEERENECPFRITIEEAEEMKQKLSIIQDKVFEPIRNYNDYPRGHANRVLCNGSIWYKELRSLFKDE